MILRKKAQTSTEMVLIIGGGLMVIIAVIMVLQESVLDAKVTSQEVGAEKIFDYIRQEVITGLSSRFTYNTTFILPQRLPDGTNYTIGMHQPLPFSVTIPTDITITIDDVEFVNYYYNISDLSSICKGKNVLSKEKDMFTVLITCIS